VEERLILIEEKEKGEEWLHATKEGGHIVVTGKGSIGFMTECMLAIRRVVLQMLANEIDKGGD
jgi:threonine dehydrogenase-like Zn-dependent dehydrogenase